MTPDYRKEIGLLIRIQIVLSKIAGNVTLRKLRGELEVRMM